MEKPEYKLEMRIVDTNTGEVIVEDFTFIDQEARYKKGAFGDWSDEMIEDNAESTFWDLFRVFRRGAQEDYEEKNYQKQEELELA